MEFFIEKIVLPFLGLLLLLMIVGLIVGFYQEMQPPEIVDGKVVELEHLKESQDLVMVPLVMNTGNTTTTILQPTYIHYPETFRVKIENGDKQEEFYVNKETYEELSIGNRFKYEPETVKRHRPEESRDATDAEIKKMEEAN